MFHFYSSKKCRLQNLRLNNLKKKGFSQAILNSEFLNKRGNGVDPDKRTENKLPHLDICCLQVQPLSFFFNGTRL